jgi:hypothetical protein
MLTSFGNFLIPTATFIYNFFLINIIIVIQVQNNCHVMDFILNNSPKLKQGLALGLLSRGLFYIRAIDALVV